MMLQKIAGSSQTIRAPKGLLRAGAPSPRRQMTSKMAPAQQSSSLLLLLLLSNRFFCFSLPPSFLPPPPFVSKPAAARPLKVFFLLFEGFGKFVLWGVWRPQFNLCPCLYWFHKALVISATCVIPFIIHFYWKSWEVDWLVIVLLHVHFTSSLSPFLHSLCGCEERHIYIICTFYDQHLTSGSQEECKCKKIK